MGKQRRQYTKEFKVEAVRLIVEEGRRISARQTLRELGLPRSTFYNWYRRYLEFSPDDLADRKAGSKRFWNRIPDEVKERVVEKAKAETELTLQTIQKIVKESLSAMAWKNCFLFWSRLHRIASLCCFRAIKKNFERFTKPTDARV